LSDKLPLAGLRHHVRFVNGADLPGRADGAGLAIFSRYPILDTAFLPFSACGRAHRVDHFDWQAGKGVGMARVLLPGEYGTADVYVAHLVAQYVDGPGDEYYAQRVLQAFEIANFMRTTRRSDLTLLCTDLNAGPDSHEYRTVSTLGGLSDAYSCTHASIEELAALHAPPPPPAEASSDEDGNTTTALSHSVGPHASTGVKMRTVYDATFGDATNSWTKGGLNNSAELLRRVGLLFRGWSGTAAPPEADNNARLDYILFGSPTATWPYSPPSALARTWAVVTADIRMRAPITLPSGERINVSDHSGVYAEFVCSLGASPRAAGLRTPSASPQTAGDERSRESSPHRGLASDSSAMRALSSITDNTGSPCEMQALDADAALGASLTLTRPAAGQAAAVHDWRPVLRETLTILERGYATAEAVRDGHLGSVLRNIVLAAALLAGAAVVGPQAGRPLYYVPFGGALGGAAAGAVVCALLLASFAALFRIRNSRTMATIVAAVWAAALPVVALLLWRGGLPGLAVAAAVACLCFAVAQLVGALTTLPSEMRGFSRAQAQLRLLLLRPPSVVG
jgi:hypothetical protein